MADQRPEGHSPSTSGDARPAGPGLIVSLIRWGLRAALVSISVACLVVAAIQGRLMGRDVEADMAPVVVIGEGPRYGEAVVGVGSEAPADDDTVRRAVREAAGRGQRIVVEVAPGVPQREASRVVGIVAAELSAGGQVYLTLSEAASKAE